MLYHTENSQFHSAEAKSKRQRSSTMVVLLLSSGVNATEDCRRTMVATTGHIHRCDRLHLLISEDSSMALSFASVRSHAPNSSFYSLHCYFELQRTRIRGIQPATSQTSEIGHLFQRRREGSGQENHVQSTIQATRVYSLPDCCC